MEIAAEMLFLAQKGTRRARRIVHVAHVLVRCCFQHDLDPCTDDRSEDGELRPLPEGSDGLHANPELPTNVGGENIAIYHVGHETSPDCKPCIRAR